MYSRKEGGRNECFIERKKGRRKGRVYSRKERGRDECILERKEEETSVF